jgi:hypothetical protein
VTREGNPKERVGEKSRESSFEESMSTACLMSYLTLSKAALRLAAPRGKVISMDFII